LLSVQIITSENYLQENIEGRASVSVRMRVYVRVVTTLEIGEHPVLYIRSCTVLIYTEICFLYTNPHLFTFNSKTLTIIHVLLPVVLYWCKI